VAEIAPRGLIGTPAAHLLRLFYPRALRSVTCAVIAGPRWCLPGVTLSSLRRDPTPDVRDLPRTRSGDPLGVFFTSGSTGEPKGVLSTHGNGAAVVLLLRDAVGLTRDDVVLACHPAFALYFTGLGMTTVLPDLDPRAPAKADPESVLRVIRDLRPTAAYMPLSVLRNLQRHCERSGRRVPHLRRIITTGAPVSVELVEATHRVLSESDADLYMMYGATEALSVCFIRGREMLDHARERMRQADGTCVGRPSAGVTVRVIRVTDSPIEQWDDELGLPPGEIGEICVRGPVVTPQYRNRPDATRRAKIPDGDRAWHRMGDAGYVDAQGYVWHCGRLDHRVETNGGALYPGLVEPVFNAHPRVVRSALVGVNGEPVILIETRGGTDADALCRELRERAGCHDRTRGITRFRVYPGSFPLDVRHNAKIRRRELQDWATAQETT
jgi:acyl-CoA synthetase (AMP-forming)/AMP-acid ligase II